MVCGRAVRYFTHPNPDARTAEYRELVGHDHWRHLSIDDLDACERICSTTGSTC